MKNNSKADGIQREIDCSKDRMNNEMKKAKLAIKNLQIKKREAELGRPLKKFRFQFVLDHVLTEDDLPLDTYQESGKLEDINVKNIQHDIDYNYDNDISYAMTELFGHVEGKFVITEITNE